MEKVLTIDEIKEGVAQIAPNFNVAKIMVIGSYANASQTSKSDVDLQVEFGKRPHSLLKTIEFRRKLEEKIGKRVDIVPYPLPENSYVKIKKAVTIYEAV